MLRDGGQRHLSQDVPDVRWVTYTGRSEGSIWGNNVVKNDVTAN